MTDAFKFTKQHFYLLGMIVLTFTAFCIEADIYAPCFPDMMRHFETNESMIQHILTANCIGICISGLFYGSLSDSYGRKPLLCLGLSIFAISSLACLFAGSIEHLILWRFIQGLGCGAITGIGTTMLFDVFPKDKSAQLIAVLNSFVSGLMASAPLIGNWINLTFGWRINFLVITAFAFVSLFVAALLVKETHPLGNRTQFSLKTAIKDYLELFNHLPFMANTLVWNIMFGLLMVFTANLSLIYIEYLNVPDTSFGFYQASIMTTFFISSLIAAKLIGKFGMLTTKYIGNTAFMMGALGLGLLSQFSPSATIALTCAMSLCSAGVAIAGTIYYVDSLASFPEAKGACTALSQSIRLVVTAGMIALAAKTFSGSIKPIGYMAIASLIAIIGLCTLIALQKRKAHVNNLSSAV